MTAAVLLMALTACKKEGPGFFQGTYGYTISGTITCEYKDAEDETQQQKKFSVKDEQGIMHIEPHGEGMVMTAKETLGGVTVFETTVSGTEISVKPLEKKVRIYTDALLQSNVSIDATVSGQGYKTGKLVVIEMKISGPDFTDGGVTYRIIESDVKLVATEQ